MTAMLNEPKNTQKLNTRLSLPPSHHPQPPKKSVNHSVIPNLVLQCTELYILAQQLVISTVLKYKT
jgi:hypothetical protein